MIRIKATTKEGGDIVSMFRSPHYDKGDIFDAYERPSANKVRAYREIENRASSTNGYNYDLRVVSKNTFSFSTMYSFTDEQGTHIIYDTPSYTREVIVE